MKIEWNFNKNEIRVDLEDLNSKEAKDSLRTNIYLYISYNSNYGYNQLDDADRSIEAILLWLSEIIKEGLKELEIISSKGEIIGKGIDYFSPTEEELNSLATNLFACHEDIMEDM